MGRYLCEMGGSRCSVTCDRDCCVWEFFISLSMGQSEVRVVLGEKGQLLSVPLWGCWGWGHNSLAQGWLEEARAVGRRHGRHDCLWEHQDLCWS